jgi:selenocysteine lyase/cysteine desulfurase
MTTSRRDFIKSLSLGVGGMTLFGLGTRKAQARLAEKIEEVANTPAEKVARDESFWFHVQQAFNTDRSIINLNNGGVHPAPQIAIEAAQRYMEFSNGAPVYNSWNFLRPRKELIRQKIASTFGCSPEEIALTRNVTEALQIALLGLELKPGDEVLTTTHDYPSMKNALYQRQKREGVKVKTFSFPYPPRSLDELTELFARNITHRTKLILVCHITNLTGQIFPIRDICRLAKQRGIPVVIDGAHAFGHFVFEQKDLECEIYGANLHKWMMAPIGSGFLYVKKEKIKDIWPLFPASDPQGDDIRKFEHVGTQPEYIKLAIGEALEFHHAIGPKRKEERLRYLRNYWARALEDLPGVRILTSYEPEQSCGIGTFTVDGLDMKKLRDKLLEKHKIYTITVKVPAPEKGKKDIIGMRITPSIYTPLRDLDMFIDAVTRYIKKGFPV